MAPKRKPKAKTTDKVEAEVVEKTTKAAKDAIDAPEVTAAPKATEPTVKSELTIKVFRDTENRLCLDMEGKVRRIAGTEDAFPEVARQIGLEIVKERLI